MLILHPSSSCDVCLDAYTWTTPENTPHAIPCGHIFCKACLVSVEPMNCPLCRKAFNRERIKKLHVDRPDDDPELALLHRIVHTFGSTNVPEKAELIAELEAWLSGRAEDEHTVLRRATDAFRAYSALEEKKDDERRRLKILERAYRRITNERENERNTSKAVESSLQVHVEALTTQIADLEAQVGPLRAELSKYQHTSNPLPPPPEPVPLDRFPAFARATAESADGFVAFFTPDPNGASIPLFPIPLPEEEPARPDKGKARQPYNTYQQADESKRNVIVPGASRSQRVIPIGANGINGHAYHTHVPATAYVDGYANGYGLGYGAASAGGDGTYPVMSNAATQGSSHERPLLLRTHDDGEDTLRDLESAIGSLRLWGVPSANAAAVAPPAPRRVSYDDVPPPSWVTPEMLASLQAPRTSRSRPAASRRSTVQIDGHLGDAEAGPSAQYRPPIYGPPRVATTATPGEGGAPLQESRPADAPAPVQSVAQHALQRRDGGSAHRENRQSYSSWGTVHTQESSHTRGSMSDLGNLANFPLLAPPVGGGNRSSIGSLDDIRANVLDREQVATPRAFQDDEWRPLGFIVAGAPGHAHSNLLPSSARAPLEPLGVLSSHESGALQRSTRSNNRRRTAPRRFSALPEGAAAAATAPPQISEFGVVAHEPEFGMRTESPPLENALGLELGREAAPAHSITAPTPRFQMSHIIRSWSDSLDTSR